MPVTDASIIPDNISPSTEVKSSAPFPDDDAEACGFCHKMTDNHENLLTCPACGATEAQGYKPPKVK